VKGANCNAASGRRRDDLRFWMLTDRGPGWTKLSSNALDNLRAGNSHVCPDPHSGQPDRSDLPGPAVSEGSASVPPLLASHGLDIYAVAVSNVIHDAVDAS